MGWSCLRFLGLPAFPFSLLPVLRFCPVPSPNLKGSAASASAHGLSGVQYTASSSASGLLALFLSACSLVSPYLSLLFVPLPLLRLSLDLWVLLLPFLSLLIDDFCGGVFGSSGSGASFLSWLSLSCLSPLVSFCCLRSSPDFWLFAVSSSFSCTLCVVLPAQVSLLRSFLPPGSSGVALPSPTLFSCLRLFFLVASWSFLLPSLTTQSSVALVALLGSVYPVHLSLLALFARPLLPFLLSLGFCSMGLLLLGPLLGLCRSPSPLLGGSLFPVLGFLRLAALLLLLLRCFLLRCL